MSAEHAHSHHTNSTNKKFIIGIALNTLFTAAELGFGLIANSLALIAYTVHNAADVLGLFLAWVGFMLAKKDNIEILLWL